MKMLFKKSELLEVNNSFFVQRVLRGSFLLTSLTRLPQRSAALLKVTVPRWRQWDGRRASSARRVPRPGRWWSRGAGRGRAAPLTKMAPPPPNSGNVTSGVCPAPRRRPGTAGRLRLGLWSGGGRAAPGGYCAAPPLQAFTHQVSGSRTAQGTRGGKADCRQEPGSDRGRAAAPGRGEASPPPGCGKGGGRASSWAPPPSGTTPGFVKLL